MATPLDAVQAGPGDVTSPSPVDTSADALAGPQPDAGQVQQAPLNGGQPLESNPTANAQPPKPSLWHNVLRGALAGLEMGGGVGAVVGAVDPKAAIQAKANRQQMQTARAQFSSLQAANAALENSQRKWLVDHLPQDQKIKISEAELPLMQDLIKEHVPFVMADADPSGKAEVAALHQLGDANGGKIPPHIQFNLPDGRSAIFYNTDKMGQNASMLDTVNKMLIAEGAIPANSPYSPEQFKALPPAQQNELMRQAKDFFNPLGKTPQDRDQLVTKYKNYKVRAEMAGDKETAQRIQDSISGLQKQNFLPELKPIDGTVNGKPATALLTQDGWVDAQTHQPLPNFQKLTPGQIAEQRGKGYGEWRVQQVIKPDGTLGFAYAKDVVEQGPSLQGSAPAAQGHKAMAQAAQINDIATGSQNMRSAVESLDRPFDSAQIGAMTLAMRATDPTIVKQIVDAKLGAQTLTPGQQQFVVSLLNLHERAMALRSVAGIGQQGSDTMRNAIVAMLPALKDDPKLMLKKLDAFDQQLSVLSKGIPKVKGQPAPGSAQQNGGATQPTPQTHVFSLGAWIKAHPNGNADAARAAAQKAGYPVVQ